MSVTKITWPTTLAELSPAEYHTIYMLQKMQSPAADSAGAKKLDITTTMSLYVSKYVHLAMLANLKTSASFFIAHHLQCRRHLSSHRKECMPHT
jgi:hypothetical protein